MKSLIKTSRSPLRTSKSRSNCFQRAPLVDPTNRTNNNSRVELLILFHIRQLHICDSGNELSYTNTIIHINGTIEVTKYCTEIAIYEGSGVRRPGCRGWSRLEREPGPNQPRFSVTSMLDKGRGFRIAH